MPVQYFWSLILTVVISRRGVARAVLHSHLLIVEKCHSIRVIVENRRRQSSFYIDGYQKYIYLMHLTDYKTTYKHIFRNSRLKNKKIITKGYFELSLMQASDACRLTK